MCVGFYSQSVIRFEFELPAIIKLNVFSVFDTRVQWNSDSDIDRKRHKWFLCTKSSTKCVPCDVWLLCVIIIGQLKQQRSGGGGDRRRPVKLHLDHNEQQIPTQKSRCCRPSMFIFIIALLSNIGVWLCVRFLHVCVAHVMRFFPQTNCPFITRNGRVRAFTKHKQLKLRSTFHFQIRL